MEGSASRQDASHRDAATTFLFVALALGALWFVLCRYLSGEWRLNDQYSYGWFVPFFVAFLFLLRWEDRPSPEVSLWPRVAYGPAGGHPPAHSGPRPRRRRAPRPETPNARGPGRRWWAPVFCLPSPTHPLP